MMGRGLSSFLLLLLFARLESQEIKKHKHAKSDKVCDIGFVLDTSGSIHKDEYRKQKKFVTQVAKDIGISKKGPHYGVILFGQFANVEIKFNEFYTKELFEQAVMKLKQPGSVTRIDRGLKKAYNVLFTKNGGSRENAQKILFLLTDGSQTEGEDVVENSYLANNLRFIGVSFYVIGIGRKVAPEQLLKIAGSPQHLYFVKSFEELKSEKFVHQFNISCGQGDEAIKMYYLNLRITNKLTVAANGGIERMNGMKEPFVLRPSESLYFRHKLEANSLPYIKVFASSELYGDMVTTEGTKYLPVNYGMINDEYSITLEKVGMSLQKYYHVYFSVVNQLKSDIIVTIIKNQERTELLVRAFHMKRDQMVKVFPSEGSVSFVAKYPNGDPVKLNGKYSETAQFYPDIDVVYKLLYTEKEKRNVITPKQYSFRYKIINIGRKDVLIYQGNGVTYELRAGAGELKRFSGRYVKQPKPIELSTSFPGEVENRKHIKYLLPKIGGSYETIFIGNDFDVQRPYHFTTSVNNLASGLATIEWKLINSDFVMHFPVGIANHNMQFSFMENIPAMQAKAFIYGLGKRKKLLVNNKGMDLISPDERNDVVKIVLSENKATKRHFLAIARNKLQNDVILNWKAPVTSLIVTPIPKNNITMLANAKRRVFWRFRSFFPINNLEIRAFDKLSGLPVKINGQDVLKTKAFSYKNIVKMSLVFGYPDAFEPVKDLVVVENSKTSLTLRWKQVPIVNGYVITIAPLNTTQVKTFNYQLQYKQKRKEVIYEISDLKPKSKYLVTVRTNQPDSKPASLIGRTQAEGNEYSISLRIKNHWTYPVIVKVNMLYDNVNSNEIDDDEMGKVFTVEGYTDVNHTIDVPLPYQKADFKIQLFEKETELLLMLPDKQEYFTVTPEKYDQPYLIEIQNDDKVSLFKPYYFTFRFYNFADSNALVFLRNVTGGLVMKKYVKAGDVDVLFETIVMYEICPLYHHMEARVDGETASINGFKTLKVIPTIQKVEIPIHIGSQEDAEKLAKTYYVDVTVKNQWKNPVMSIWPQGLTLNRLVSPAQGSKQKVFAVSSDNHPQDLLFKLVDKVTNQSILIDEQMSVFLKYNQILQPVVIVIDADGNAHMHWSYFLIIQVNNFYTEKAIVRWNNDVMLEIDGQESKLHKVLMHRTSKPVGIIFEALTRDDDQLFINNQKQVLTVPSLIQDVFAFNITDGTDSGLKFQVSLINMLDNEVKVVFDGGLVRKVVNVDYKLMKKVDIESPSPLIFKISAEDINTGESVNVNGSSNIVIDPVRRKNEVFVLFIGATEEQLESTVRPFFFYVVFKNFNPKDITVKWNEPVESGKHVVNIPAGQIRVRRNIFISKEQPKSVQFKFETSSTHRLLPNNKLIQVQPSSVFRSTPTEIVLDADATTTFYFLNLVIVNKLPYTTNLKISSPSFDMPNIAVGASKYIERQIRVNTTSQKLEPVMITAGSNGDVDFINGVNTGIKVEFSREQKTTYLFLGYEGPKEDVPFLKVLFIKLTIFNNRTSPISIKADGIKSKSLSVLNKSRLAYETIMVGKDIIKQLVLKIRDYQTGKLLMVGDKGSITLKRKKLKDRLFSIAVNLGLSEKNERKVIYEAVLRFSIMNHLPRKVKIVQQINNTTRTFTIEKRTRQTITQTLPVYNPDGNMVLRAIGELLSGQKEVIIPLSSKEIVTNLEIGKQETPKKIELTVHNTLSENVTVKWDVEKGRKINQVVPPRGRLNIVLYTYKSQTNDLEITAVNAKEIFLNGVKRTKFPLNYIDEFNQTIVVTGTSDKRDIMVILDLHNKEDFPVIVRRSFGITINNILSDLKLAPNEQRRVYMNFPRYVSSIDIRAFSLVKNQLMVINGKFALSISPDDCGCIVKGQIRKFGGPIRMKYELDVNNQASKNVTVYWVVNGTKFDNIIPSGDRNLICGTFEYDAPDVIEFRARTAKQKLLFGGKEVLEVKPTVENHTIFLTITERGIKQTGMKDYVLVLYFINKMDKDVNLFWDLENNDKNKGYVTEILAGEKKLLELRIRSNKRPNPIIFTGSQKEGLEKVKLNGRFQIRFQPSTNRKTIEVFIDPKDRPVKIYFLNINFVVDYPLAVDIEWTINKVRRLLTLQKYTNFTMRDVIRVTGDEKPKMISFYAWDVTKKCNLFMNGMIMFKLQPSTDPTKNTTVVVSKASSIFLYKLLITNNNLEDVKIESNLFQKKNGKVVQTSQLFTEVIPGKSINLTRTKPMDTPCIYVNLIATDVKTGKRRYINEKLEIKLKPYTKSEPEVINIVNIGDIVRQRPYMFKLRVTNLVPSYVALNYSINGTVIKKYIRPYDFNFIITGQIKANVTPDAILFNSFVVKKNTKLFTNDMGFFPVVPVLQKNLKIIQVYLSYNKTTKNLTIYFRNPTNNPITINWKTTSFKGTVVIPEKSKKYPVIITTNGDYRKQTVFIEPVSDDKGDIVVNQNSNFTTRIPYEKEIIVDYIHKNITFKNLLNEEVTVYLEKTGITRKIPGLAELSMRIPGNYFTKKGITVTARKYSNNGSVMVCGKPVCKLSLGDMFRVIEIGGKTKQTNKFFLKLWISNNHDGRVVIKYTKDGRSKFKTYEVPKGFNKMIILSFKTDTPLSLTGVDKKTGKAVYLNRRDMIKCVPLKTNKYAKTIVISGEIYLYDYFYRLLVNNYALESIRIQLVNGKEIREAIVPANSVNNSINTPLSNLKLGPKQPMKALAFSNTSLDPLYINKNESVNIFPTLDDEDATVINVFGKKLPFILYFYSMLVTVPKYTNVNLTYTLDGRKLFSRIPMGSIKFSVVIPFHSFTTPKNITIKAIDEDKKSKLLVNKKMADDITPNLGKEIKQPVIVTKPGMSEATIFRGWTIYVNNPNQFKVKLKSTYRGKTFITVIPANADRFPFTYNITEISTSSEPLGTHDFVAESELKNLKVNGSDTLKVKDSLNENEIFLNIEQLKMTNITFENKLKKNITLRITRNNKTKVLVIPKDGKTIKVLVGEKIKVVPVDEVLLNKTQEITITTTTVDKQKVLITKPYKLNVIVKNKKDTSATIIWTAVINGTKVVTTSENFTINYTSLPDKIKFTAVTEDKKTLLINNKTSLEVNPKDYTEVITISLTKQLQQYNYCIEVNNNLPVPTQMNCKYGNKVQKIMLDASELKKKLKFSIMSTDVPESMTCTSVVIEPGITPMLNKKSDKYDIKPNTDDANCESIDISFPTDAYYISLKIMNLVNSNVTLQWNATNRNGVKVIPSKAKNKTLFIFFKDKRDIKVVAQDVKGTELLVNSRKIMLATSTPDKERSIYVEISKDKVKYYFSITVNNKNDIPVKLNCSYNDTTKVFDLKANEMNRKIQVAVDDSKVPESMVCFVMELKPSGVKPNINEKEIAIIEPKIDPEKYDPANITLPKGTEFINLMITNLVDKHVSISWISEAQKGSTVITPSAKNVSVKLLFPEKTEIKLHVVDVDEKPLLVNMKQEFKTTSSDDKTKITYVEIGRKKEKYYYSFEATNNNSVPVKLNCTYGNKSKVFELKANESKKKIQVVVEDSKSPESMKCTSPTIDPGLKPLVNDKEVADIKPDKDPKKYGQVIVTLKAQYITLIVTNRVDTVATLQWNTKDRKGEEKIAAKKEKKKVIILFTKKSDIDLKAVDTTKKTLLVNTKETMKASSSNDMSKTILVEITRKKLKYYYSIEVTNNNSVPVKLNCTYGNKSKIFEIKENENKKQFQVTVEADKAPEPMTCTSPNIDLGIQPLLNKEKVAVVKAETDSKKYTTIVVTLDAHYILMIITNLVENEANLNWNSKARNGLEVIAKKASNKSVLIMFKDKTTIKVSATSKNSAKKDLLVNKKLSMDATSSKDRTKATYVEISEIKNTLYFYSLTIDNKMDVPVKLICRYNKTYNKTIDLLGNERKKQMQITIESKDKPENMNCTAASIDPGFKPDLNSKKSVIIEAKKKNKDYTNVVVTYPDGLHFIRLLITNLVDSEVKLKWNSTDKKKSVMIANGTNNRNHLLIFLKETAITLTSTGKRKFKLFLNEKYVEDAMSSEDNKKTKYIEISSGELFYSFTAENAELFDATVKWTFKRKNRTLSVEGLKTKDLSFRAMNTIDALELTAHRDWRKKAMYLNNNLTFLIYPQRTEYPYTYILLSMEQRSLVKYLYISLFVTNLVKSDVNLYIGNQSRVIKLKATDYKILIPYDKSLIDNKILTIRADVSNSQNEVFVNAKRVINIELQKNKEPARSLLLTDFSSKRKLYYVQVEVQNNHHKDVIIKYREGGVFGKLREIYATSAYHKWYDVAFIRKTRKPITAEFMVVDAASDAKLYISGKVSVIYRPVHQNGTLVLSIGEAVPKKKFDPSIGKDHLVQRFFGFHITNDGTKDATITWEENGVKKELIVPGKSSREYTTLVDVNPSNPFIYLKAVDTRLSGRKVWYIKPNKAKQINYYHVNVDEDHTYKHRYYYYGMKIDNRAKYDVKLSWTENGVKKELLSKSHTIQDFHSVIRSKRRPRNVIIIATRTDTGEKILLNGLLKVLIKPQRQQTRMYILIRGETADLNLKYYWGLDVKNLLKKDVVLYWMENGQRQSLAVKGYGSQHYDAVITSKTQPGSINVTASLSGSSESIKIYNQYFHMITPVRERGRTVLVIGNLGDGRLAPQLYKLTVQVINDDKRNLVLQWFENGEKKEMPVKAKSLENRQISVLSKTQPKPIIFQVIDPNSKKFGSINGKTYYTAQPRIDGRYLHIYISGDPAQKDRDGKCHTRMDLAFLLDGSGTMKQVYPYAKAFIMMLAEEFHLSPNHTHIGIIVFSETAILEIPFNRHQEHDAFQEDVNNLHFVGYRTHLNIAFNEANEHLFDVKYGSRADARKVLIVLTDGRHNSADNSDAEIRKAQEASIPLLNKNVTIVVIGLFGSVAADAETLSHIAGNKTENVFMVAHSPDLLSRNFLDSLVYKYCNQYKTIRATPLGKKIARVP